MSIIDQWLHPRNQSGEKPLSELQLQQAKARILLTCASLTYVMLHGDYFDYYQVEALSFAAFYFATNIAAIFYLRRQSLKAAAMLFYAIQDTLIVSFGMLIDGGHSSGVFFMLLPIIIGNGLRFGNPMLLVAQGLCTIGLLLMTIYSVRVMNQPIDFTLLSWQLFTLVAVPFYVYLIGRKLETVMREKTAVEESSFHLIDKGPAAVFTFELDKHFTPIVQYANHAIADMFHTTQNQLIGQPAGSLAIDEDKLELNRYCQSIFKQENVVDREHNLYVRGTDASGNVIKLSVRAIRMRWHNRWIGICVLLDVTQRETMQEQLETVHRQSYISTMVAGIVHDFRNVLTNMIGYAEVIQMGMSKESDKQQIEEIIAAGERGSELITHLLKLNRKSLSSENTKLTEGRQIKQPLENIIGLARLQLPAKIKMESEIREPLPDVSVSLIEIEQILLNLINNATQAIHQSGEINILIRGDHKHPLATETSPALSIRITDNGIGINTTDLENIFKPFWSSRTRHGGSGLGLTMVERIVKLHHGRIEVISEPNSHTTFEIHFPPYSGQKQDSQATTDKAPVQAKTHDNLTTAPMSILVVDDGVDILKIHKALLERMGHTVMTADSGWQAIERLQSQPFGMIITDFRMPGMNGLELVEHVRQQHPDLPILMVTAFGEDEHLEQVPKYRAAIIHKPTSFKSLEAGMRDALSLTQ